jgi:HPt (histidine-containing phosphotransfer) domain-containing protein
MNFVPPSAPTPVAPPRPRLFNPEPFLLSIDNDVQAFAELAAMFDAMCDAQLARIAFAIADGDAAEACAAAHALAGSLALFGAAPAVTLTQSIEASCRRRSVPREAAGLLEGAAVALAELRIELRDYCRALAPAPAAASAA